MSIIILPVLMLFTIQAIDAYGSSTCFDYSRNGLISEMKNCRSYFHYATLFSDLSRNMTSSSDLFEDNNENTQLQDNVENNDTEIDQQDEITELEGNNDNNTIFG